VGIAAWTLRGNTPVEVQFTSAGCLNYPCRTPVELLCSSFSIDLCCRGGRAPYEAIEAVAGADRTSLRVDVRIADRPSNCSADLDLGVHAIRPLIAQKEDSCTAASDVRRLVEINNSLVWLITALANAYAGTTYGNLSVRRCCATDGFSPEGTAVPATRDIITSGALSASVRPLRVAKPNVAGVPTT